MIQKFLSIFSLFLLTSAAMAQEVDTLTLNHPEYQSTLPIGKKVPKIEAADTLGITHSLSDFRGKYVVLDFWATWCGDCRREIPFLKTLYNDYKDVKVKDIPIVWLSFSFDTKEESWKNIIRKEQFPWLQISNLKSTREDSTFKDYQLKWIPAFLIIDPDGKLVSTAITADGLRNNLKALTGTQKPSEEELKEMKRILEKEKHPTTGGYGNSVSVSQSDIELFNKTYKGEVALTPISVKTQVVAGYKHDFLCEDKNGEQYSVIIFVPLEGEPEIFSFKKLISVK
ncbi:MAG: redoxin domain-containing protein [Prevotellaceae bacterium]|nr:redoxin domain-containing protein [Candidatus Minthosoma equi]